MVALVVVVGATEPNAPLGVPVAVATTECDAWQRVATAGVEMALVVTADARLLVSPDALDELSVLVPSAGVLDLAAEAGVAYLLTATAAAALRRDVAVERLTVDPPLAVRGRLIETTPEELATALQGAAAGDVILALEPGRARRIGREDSIVAAVDRLDVPVVGAGRSLAGRVDAVAAWLAAGGRPEGVRPDDGGVVFHRVDTVGGTSLVVHGRLLDTARGIEPGVAVSADPHALAKLGAELADGGGRDLARILRYDDAAARGAEVVELAPDVVAMPFWTTEFCATVIRAAEAVDAFGSAEDDPVPGHEVSLAAISPRLYAHLEDDLAVRVVPVLRRTWPTIDYAGIRDAFVIKYTPSGQSELRLHHDVAQLSAAVKLNSGYEGGILEFPRQGFTTADVGVGTLVVWPSLVTHPHRSTSVGAGVKYSLTIWFELPDLR